MKRGRRSARWFACATAMSVYWIAAAVITQSSILTTFAEERHAVTYAARPSVHFVMGMAQAPALESVRRELEAAEQAYASGARPEALKLFSGVIDALGAPAVAVTSPEWLARALYYRARLANDAGRPADARSDLERLFSVAPETVVDRTVVGAPFAELVDTIRAGTVAELEIVVTPAGAEVAVDGRRLSPQRLVAATLPGRHVIEATSPGYAPHRRELDVPAPGRVRLELRLQRLSETAVEEELAVPTSWSVWHLHRASYCGGRLYLRDDRIGYRTSTDEAHSWDVPLSQVRDVAGNRSLAGGLKYGGSFHIQLAGGQNYNFTLDVPVIVGVPRQVPERQGEQLISQLRAAVDRHKRQR